MSSMQFSVHTPAQPAHALALSPRTVGLLPLPVRELRTQILSAQTLTATWRSYEWCEVRPYQRNSNGTDSALSRGAGRAGSAPVPSQ
jgi:hypothetical protein